MRGFKAFSSHELRDALVLCTLQERPPTSVQIFPLAAYKLQHEGPYNAA